MYVCIRVFTFSATMYTDTDADYVRHTWTRSHGWRGCLTHIISIIFLMLRLREFITFNFRMSAHALVCCVVVPARRCHDVIIWMYKEYKQFLWSVSCYTVASRLCKNWKRYQPTRSGYGIINIACCGVLWLRSWLFDFAGTPW